MISTHPMLSNARFVVPKNTKSMPRLGNKELSNTTIKHLGNITIHGIMTKTIPHAIANDRM